MPNSTAELKVAHLFSPVKSTSFNKLSTPPKPMIHHKDYSNTDTIIYKNKGKRIAKPYGVSSSYRVLSPQRLIKRFDSIRDCLQFTLGLTIAEREVALRLLRFWAYYGKVYPKESTVTELPGCSKATFWRTIGKLRELGLIQVINRYIIRENAQISNLYRLDRLVLLLARYLAEHGIAFREKWLTPALTMPGRLFWRLIYQAPGARAAPGILACEGP